jgi:hypothetical protein
MIYTRGLKLKSIEGPHSKEKMFCGPQIDKKKLLRSAISKKNSPSPKKAKFDQKFKIFHF